MSKWHTDRQEAAGVDDAQTLCVADGRLAGVGRQHGLALGVSRQSRLVWLLAFALAILAHLAMTVWVMMRVTPQTGTQRPAAVSMLFEAPRTPLPATGDATQEQPAQSPPDTSLEDVPDMDAQPLAQDMPEVVPPSVQPEAEHLPPVPAVPKKLAPSASVMQHESERRMRATPVPNALHTAAEGLTGHTQAKTGMVATGGQSTAPASTAAAGQQGGFQLSCSAPEAHYPVSARHLHEEGEALAEVSINGKGQVIAARLIKSTGYDDLDEQALQTVKTLHCTPSQGSVVTGRIPVGFHIQ